MRPGHALDRLPPWGWALLALVATAASFRLGLGLEGGDGAAARDGAAATAGAEARGSLRGYRVRLEDGRLVSLAPEGEPAVVMVSSVSCAVCAEAMRDFGRQAGDRPLPRLRVVTLEGAALGAPMLARHGLAAWHAGPADGSGQTLLTFQFPGTPTFLLLDEAGAVRAALPGYPGRERFAPWFRVITGERSSL